MADKPVGLRVNRVLGVLVICVVVAMWLAMVLAYANSLPVDMAPSTPRPTTAVVNICAQSRASGAWFPHQVETRFKEICDVDR